MRVVTTESGAVYVIDEDRVTGGSKNLKRGVLANSPVSIGKSMVILAQERAHLNPQYKEPAVMSTPVVQIELT